jgi:hypothetical protein
MPLKINLRPPRIRLPDAWRKAKITPEFVKETCLLVGFFMFLRGSWLIYPPAMWVFGGAGLIWFGLPGKVGAK